MNTVPSGRSPGLISGECLLWLPSPINFDALAPSNGELVYLFMPCFFNSRWTFWNVGLDLGFRLQHDSITDSMPGDAFGEVIGGRLSWSLQAYSQQWWWEKHELLRHTNNKNAICIIVYTTPRQSSITEDLDTENGIGINVARVVDLARQCPVNHLWRLPP